MAVVVFHTLASAFVYFRDRCLGFIFGSRDDQNINCSNHSGSGGSCFGRSSRTEYIEETFVPILDATSVIELREAAYASLKLCLPKVECVKVFLANPWTDRIEDKDGAGVPSCSIIRDAFHQTALHVHSLPQDEQVLNLLKISPSDSLKILLLPISSRQSDFISGIIVASFRSESLSIEEERYLNLLMKQVAVAYRALRRPQFESVAANLRLESLISLCGELYDQDAAVLELKVLRYLREQTSAESGFLLLVVPETLELISQVVGNKILPEEVRFSGPCSCFAQALETKRPMTLTNIAKEKRPDVEKIVQIKVMSFLCVPVARKGSEDLIALACLVNKMQGQSFTESDIQVVNQCFKYTATVLTSTLAFQNERKLKNQTQALLHVARKLFTRLGESSNDVNKVKENSPKTELPHIKFALAVTRFISGFRIKHADSKDVPEIKKDSKHFEICDIRASRSETPSVVTFFGGFEKKNLAKNTTNMLSPPQQIDGFLVDSKLSGDKMSLVGSVRRDEGNFQAPAKKAGVESKKDSRKYSFIRKSLQSLVHSSSSKHSESVVSLPLEADGTLPEEESKRVKLQRTMSKNMFTMFDPTCAEAEISSDDDEDASSDTSNKEEDLVITVGKQKTDNISEQMPLTKIQDKPAGIPIEPKKQKRSQVMFFNTFSALSKSRTRLLTLKKPSHIQDSEPSEATEQYKLSSKSKVSRFAAGKAVPFSEVRKWPDKYFPTGSLYGSLLPSIRLLLKEAPSDDDLTKLLREIMQEARNLTDAERCSVFLLDRDSNELVATVFDGITTNNKEVQSEIRLPKTQGIAGHVATTGTLLNIKDAYSHPLFYRGIDDSTGFKTRNILCFPIKDEEGVVLGVAQLCNKKTGTYFTTFDEDIASAFAVYCCISISHSLMYKKVIDIQYRNSLANELMMFHMKCLIYKKLQDTQHRHMLANELLMFHMKQIPAEEVLELSLQGHPNVRVFDPEFDTFIYPPRCLAESKSPGACQAMFEDLGFINRWRLKSDTLARFLLMVKKGYRNPPYHNWMHAFAVAHFGYLCIKNLKLEKYLDDIELFALFVSCLCHDIDHRGTTNSFQVKSQSVLAALYSSEGSVMERHHLAQSMCILNTEGSNIFENLSSKDYQQVLDLMKDIILATDVAHHLRIFPQLEEMSKTGYKKNNPKHRNLLLCLLMTASDLSDQTKDWNNTKQIAVLIYQEFFSQGDLEKALGESPLEMMDRERACVPDLQISFLDNIAMPVYRVLAEIFPKAKEVELCVADNRQHWVRKAQMLKVHNNSAQSMSVQEIIALGEDVEDVEMEKEKKALQHNGR